MTFDWNTWWRRPAAEKVVVWNSLIDKAQNMDFESMTLEEKKLMTERINGEDQHCDCCDERYPCEMTIDFDEDTEDSFLEAIGAEEYASWCAWCVEEALKPKCINCGTSNPNKEECVRYMGSTQLHFDAHDFPLEVSE